MKQAKLPWVDRFPGCKPFLLFAVFMPGCNDPADPPLTVDPNVDPNVEWTITADRYEQGILSYVYLRARATDADGEPVPGLRVDWTVDEGNGLVGQGSNLDAPHENPLLAATASRETDASGLARVSWSLGPRPGVQYVTVQTPGSVSVTLAVNATPGVVLVGEWRLPGSDADLDLPSDTMHVHATGAGHIAQAREWLDAGEQVRIWGYIRRGQGIDTNWIFHLEPAWASATTAGGAGMCTARPPLTEEQLTAVVESSYTSLCPWVLHLVDIRDVPAEYLEALGGGE